MVYKKDIWFILLIIAISFLWWITVFSKFQPLDRCDWDKVFSYHELQRKTILRYRQFPLWNPYICGGEPWLAHPNSDFLSPYFLFILFFGSIRGTAFIYFLQVSVGLTGMYFLSRHYRLNYVLSLLNSIFFLNLFNIITFVGLFPSLNISLVPWIYLVFNKSKERKKYLFLLAIFFSYLIYAGSIYIFIIGFMLISIDAIHHAITRKKPRIVLSLLRILFFASLLSSLKLIPMIELLIQYPRHMKLAPFPGFFNIDNVRAGFLELRHLFFSGNNLYSFSQFLDVNIFGYHFSVLTILLLISSYFLLWRRYRILLIMNIIFLLLALGDNSPLNIWRLFHHVLPSFKEPYKFFMGFLTISSLCIGLTIKEVKAKIPRIKISNFIASVILISVSFNVLNCAGKIFKEKMIIEYNLNNRVSGFFQRAGNYKKMFETVYNNHGVVYGYDNIGNQIQTRVIPKEHRDYKGEYFLANDSGKVKQMSFSPNRLKFNINLSKDDILVINQNYFRGWRSSAGRAINYGGLIGTPVKKEEKEVAVYYLPDSFILGVIIFACSVSVLIYLKMKRRKISSLFLR